MVKDLSTKKGCVNTVSKNLRIITRGLLVLKPPETCWFPETEYFCFNQFKSTIESINLSDYEVFRDFLIFHELKKSHNLVIV